jgi:XTP/dITP diphosphohydrolase
VTLLVATTNAGKLREIRGALAETPHQLVTLADLPDVAEPEETGATFEENARLKALYYDRHLATQVSQLQGSSDLPVLTVAEDSGLVIDALGGEPGIRSARFLGPDATYPERFAEIERRLRGNPGAPRSARFVCALAAVAGGTVMFETRGVVEGAIAEVPAGEGGFGYDPIFYFPPYGQTLAQVTSEEKRRVAHRGEAFRALVAWLEGSGPGLSGAATKTKNGER